MIWLLWLPVTLAAPGAFPLVDPGLFVISGVKTCGEGSGYCLLGLDCTLDEDFLPDTEEGQHCEGLRSAFTPSAHFVCCRAANKSVYKSPTVATTSRTTATLDILENEIDQVLHKVAESVDAVKKTPLTDPTETSEAVDEAAEMREDEESDESSLLEEEMLESSLEGEVLQGMVDKEEDYEEEMQADQGGKDTILGSYPANQQEATSQRESPTKHDGAVEELKTDELDDERSTEESTSSENKNSNEDNDESEENVSTTVTTEFIEDHTNVSSFNESIQSKEDYTEKNYKDSQENEILSDKPETTLESVEENLTKDNNSNENLKEDDSGNDVLFNADKHTQESATNSVNESNAETKENVDSIKRPSLINNIDLNETSSKNVTNTSLSNKVITKSKPSTEKVPNSKDNSNTPIDTKLNEVVVIINNNKINENRVQHVTNDQSKQGNVKVKTAAGTNITKDKSSQTETTTDAKGELDTSGTVSPAPAPDQITTQGHESGVGVLQGSQRIPCSRGSSKNCTEEVKFEFQNRTLCFGSVYGLDWVVTSASCALRIFRVGMVNVTIAPMSGMSRSQVKTIIVHESYVENAGSTGQQMEANNIGLVQLKSPMTQWAQCLPCLPEQGHQLQGNCSAVTSRPMASPNNCSASGSCKSGRAEVGMGLCKGIARDMTDDLGFHYLTLPCDTLWEPRFTESPRGSGSPLFCDGVLAGLEASSGVGLMVYTPLVRYLNWLQSNTRSGPPDQHFNVG